MTIVLNWFYESGSFSRDGRRCGKCPAGKYCSSDEASTCPSCNARTYSLDGFICILSVIVINAGSVN